MKTIEVSAETMDNNLTEISLIADKFKSVYEDAKLTEEQYKLISGRVYLMLKEVYIVTQKQCDCEFKVIR